MPDTTENTDNIEPEKATTRVVGVRFKPAGKVYDFDAGAFVLGRANPVVVETEQGLSLGTVAVPPQERGIAASGSVLKKVFRLATEADFQQIEANHEIEKKAHAHCLECIGQLGLKMSLFAVESTFDGSKLTFFFTAEGRIDFRQLVKMLVKQFGVRIEMRQVGIRHMAKMLGGVGRCGRPLCCATFMDKFGPVSIRMAKEQGLSLNPTKISGQCGRLMCCLTFENEIYQELNRRLPKPGKIVQTPNGPAKVLRHNALRSRILVRYEGGQEAEIPWEEKEETGNAKLETGQEAPAPQAKDPVSSTQGPVSNKEPQ
jgi:cell fate regulator YaaT (PSP1 superfamily)